MMCLFLLSRRSFVKMDLELFKMLQSISDAEKRLGRDMRTESYDASTLELKYPHNVITVASPTGNAPPPLPGETRVAKLYDAIYTAQLRAVNAAKNNGTAKSCSIVVHEGIYIDTFDQIPLEDVPCPEDFSLEIVGIKNFRLVIHKLYGLIADTMHLTLKNILIFDQSRYRVPILCDSEQ